MKTLLKLSATLIAILSLGVLATGCKEKTPMEKAGDDIKKAAESTADAAKDAAAKTADAAKDGAKKVEDAVTK
ncbi:MAG TPA: YtxH domain-containing protein [Candidatus Limnocylindria bacterium]|jgi:hypothetical protein|nr:YtxH domain-containing protein [Candidatus Limnocylindria bacterium]